jgi:hypothetical protein
MDEAVHQRAAMVARMPGFSAEDNTRKLADDVEAACGAGFHAKAPSESGVVAGS